MTFQARPFARPRPTVTWWRLAVVLLAATFVATPLAAGAASTVNATVVIAGASPNYTVTFTNTGTEPIKCWVLSAPVAVSAVTGPAGWRTRITSVKTAFGASSDPGIRPGASAAFAFTTLEPYPVNAGGNAFVSPTCTGSDVGVIATGPAAVTPPPKPCTCRALSAKLANAPRIRPTSRAVALRFAWNMDCTNGAGGCKGALKLSQPRVLGRAASKPPGTLRLNLKRLAFVCQANCGAGKLGRVETRMVSGRQLKALFGTTLAYGIKTTCGGKTRTSTLKVAVDRNGRLRQVR